MKCTRNRVQALVSSDVDTVSRSYLLLSGLKNVFLSCFVSSLCTDTCAEPDILSQSQLEVEAAPHRDRVERKTEDKEVWLLCDEVPALVMRLRQELS